MQSLIWISTPIWHHLDGEMNWQKKEQFLITINMERVEVMKSTEGNIMNNIINLKVASPISAIMKELNKKMKFYRNPSRCVVSGN